MRAGTAHQGVNSRLVNSLHSTAQRGDTNVSKQTH